MVVIVEFVQSEGKSQTNSHNIMAIQGKTQLRKKKKKANVLPYLHHDVISDIFMRLAETDSLLLGFKYQCKLWSTIISNPVFIDDHLHTSPTGVIAVKYINNASAILFIEFNGLEFKERELATFPSKLRVLSSCNGFVVVALICSGDDLDIYVLNPITKQMIKPPSWPFDMSLMTFSWVMLVFVPSTKEYKLVASLRDVKKPYSDFYIWTVGGDNLWREIDAPQVLIKYAGNDILVE
ncbi:hypothetical protein GIB67_007275 [Kingdonia uniflora]|uniref:F-box protein n=1 Tax=Kingdonia uniflora TaxID=39325 RepID=A0A7J7NXT5_9MAGN|nr:hypothetical protein GIB67_007275 [Kingdonia uniflora]